MRSLKTPCEVLLQLRVGPGTTHFMACITCGWLFQLNKKYIPRLGVGRIKKYSTKIYAELMERIG